MKKAIKSALAISILLIMVFMVFFASLTTHEHMCEHAACMQCEFLRSISDLFLLFLVLSAILAIAPVIVSLLAFILTKYRGTELTPIKLRDKLSN